MATKAGTLDFCGICSARLPLRAPNEGEVGTDWECAGCGTVYFAILKDGAPSDQLRNVKAIGTAITEDPVHEALRPSGTSRSASPGVLGVQSRMENALSRRIDLGIADGSALFLPAQMVPFSASLSESGNGEFSAELMKRHFLEYRTNSTRVSGLFSALEDGRHIRMRDTEGLTKELLDLMREDTDLQIALSLNAIQGEYPSNQGLRVAVLSASIASTLGFDEETLLKLSLGCIVHDVGMLSVRKTGFDTDRMFSAADFSEVASHPLHTFELLRREADMIPPESLMVAYQMHERCDGQGYPRGRGANQIHALAKIAAVADAFVAMVSPRPHRDAMMPYFAIEKLVQDARAGLYDSNAVRGLLRCVSLFPIGSAVSIGDEMVGRVLRTNREQYDRPIVEIRLRGKPKADPVVIDLANYDDLPIRPVSPDAVVSAV